MRYGASEDVQPRGKQPAATVLKLYTAQDCSLCAEVREALSSLQEGMGFTVELVDITGDPQLESKYRSRIPVAEIDGHVVFKYRMDEERLREALGRAHRRV